MNAHLYSRSQTASELPRPRPARTIAICQQNAAVAADMTAQPLRSVFFIWEVYHKGFLGTLQDSGYLKSIELASEASGAVPRWTVSTRCCTETCMKLRSAFG